MAPWKGTYIQTGLDPPFPTNIVLRILEYHQQLIIKGNLGERSDRGGGGFDYLVRSSHTNHSSQQVMYWDLMCKNKMDIRKFYLLVMSGFLVAFSLCSCPQSYSSKTVWLNLLCLSVIMYRRLSIQQTNLPSWHLEEAHACAQAPIWQSWRYPSSFTTLLQNINGSYVEEMKCHISHCQSWARDFSFVWRNVSSQQTPCLRHLYKTQQNCH